MAEGNGSGGEHEAGGSGEAADFGELEHFPAGEVDASIDETAQSEAQLAGAGDRSDSRPPEITAIISEIAERPGISESDSETIRTYLETNNNDFLSELQRELEALHASPDNLPTRQHLDTYTPHPAWFTRETLLHGTAHQMRVVVLLKLISGMVGADLSDEEQDALARAGSMHDTRRSHDGDDPEHGMEAANFAKDINRVADQRTRVSPRVDELSQQIMMFHLTDDSLFERSGDERFKLVMRIFKDADAWDRYRDKGGHPEGPDPRFIRFKETVSRISYVAEALADISGTLIPPGEKWKAGQAEAVVTAAHALGLLQAEAGGTAER